jgi:hypothetical protein
MEVAFIKIMIVSICVFIVSCIFYFFNYLFNGSYKFWRLVGKYPDLAIDFFEAHNYCWYCSPTKDKSLSHEWVGPFTFYYIGVKILVYGKAGEFEKTQKEFIKKIKIWEKTGKAGRPSYYKYPQPKRKQIVKILLILALIVGNVSNLVYFIATDVGDTKKAVPTDSNAKVYICTGKYSERYHNSKTCRGMKACKGEKKEVKLFEAKRSKKAPCEYCYKIINN